MEAEWSVEDMVGERSESGEREDRNGVLNGNMNEASRWNGDGDGDGSASIEVCLRWWAEGAPPPVELGV